MNSTVPIKAPVISELAGREEMRLLLEEFVRALPGKAAALARMVQNDNFTELARLAHQLRGSAGGYGFPIITRAAARLEEAARLKTDLEVIAISVDEICDLCNRATSHP